MSTSVHEPKTHPEQHDKASSGVVQTVEKEVKPLQALLRKFSNDWSMTLSAALAYNILLATFPILVALLAILGLLLGAFGQNASGLVLQALTNALPKEIGAANIVRGVEQNLARSSVLLSIIAVLTAIFGGSRLFILLETCFCIIYRVRPLQNTPIGSNALLASAAGFLGGLIASFILFEFIYVVVPNQHIRLRHGWLGAAVAAVALQIYLLLFPLYASHFLNGVAGAIGFAVILIVFFYYFAVILILGAEINAYFAEGVRPIPNDLATFVSTMAGRLNEDIPADESEAHVNPKPTEVKDKEHAVEFVTQTEERDVPERVAQDPEIQDSVLKRTGRETGNASTSDGRRSDSSSTEKVEQSRTKEGAESSSRKSSERGAVVGAIVGTALVFLVDVLGLRHR
ncbi:MAG: YihY/virulence factor BrkB family protein [Chloroflexi bacterium]|nr:MAG: YihY/virulence factor BrkB family protein [Chloroflexota bacterium]